MKKNGFAPLIIILVIAILGVVGYFGYKSYFVKLSALVVPSPAASNIPNDADVFSQISTAIYNTKNLDKRFIVSVSKSNNSVMYWHTQNGYLIATPNSQQVLLKYNCTPASGGDLRTVVSTLVANITTTLKQNGFQRTSTNPSLSGTDWSSAYWGSDNYINEKSNLYCNLSVDLSCGGAASSSLAQSLYFTCNSKGNYDESYSNQIKQLSDMGIKESTLDELSSYGDYHLFGGGSEFGPGAYLVAKKTDGKWVKLFSLQDNPGCSIMDKYKVPHQLGSVLAQCVDSKGNLVNNPN